ncbi:MAG TPA: CPBP family intramembrane glutamic endopeptidase [Bacteroidales bacterium]|nr:CPBP family intramembrane glutamic endopeptidase [Bacteroidales bacterium]
MKQDTPHSLSKSILLHLLPGLLAGICYFSLAPIVRANGFPSIMAIILSGVLVLIPFELGFLIYRQKATGKKLFGDVILYWKKIPFRQYFLFVPLVILLSGLLMKALGFTSGILMDLFRWIPADRLPDMGIGGTWNRSNLAVTYALFLVIIVFALPVLEEFYFRGFLLPRMPARLRGFAPVLHSLLFALYHTWTPWMVVTRTIAVLPLIYIVRRKQNLLIGIIAHCLLNSIDFIAGLVFLLG